MSSGGRRRARRLLFAAEAGESTLILGVDGGDGATSGVALASAATGSATTAATTITTTITTTTTTATITTATATSLRARSVPGAPRGGFQDTGVESSELVVGLLSTLALLLGNAGREVVLLLVLGDGLAPVLIRLGALVSLANVELTKRELLLGLLGEVVGVGDAVVLGLRRGQWGGILRLSLLLLLLGDVLAGIFIGLLGTALVGAPTVSRLLVRSTMGRGSGDLIIAVVEATATATSATRAATSTTGTTGLLLGAAGVVTTTASVAITESTIVASKTTTAVTAVANRLSGSLGLGTTGTGARLVSLNGLDGAAVFRLGIVPEELEHVL